MTPYKIWKGKKLNLKYLYIFFGTKCFMLLDHEKRGKFESKSDEGVFLRYLLNRRVYNKRTRTIMETMKVVVDDQPKE